MDYLASASFYLLAHFRVREAASILLEVCPSIGGLRHCECFCRDVGALLATMNPDPDFLVRAAVDPKHGGHGQAAVMDALRLLVAWGEVPRKEIVPYVRKLLNEIPCDASPDPSVWISWDMLSILLPKRECDRQRKKAYNRRLIDSYEPPACSFDENVSRWIEYDPPLYDVPGQLTFSKVEGDWLMHRADRVEWWQAEKDPIDLVATVVSGGGDTREAWLISRSRSGFPTREMLFSEDLKPYEDPSQDTRAPSGPILRTKPQPITVRKIGRNESCLCGSGKKYKKCCLSRLLGSAAPIK